MDRNIFLVIKKAVPPPKGRTAIYFFYVICGDYSSYLWRLFPLNYTLYLIFRELAIIGDIYRGQYKQRTPP